VTASAPPPRAFEFGVVLPNHGSSVSLQRLLDIASAAEDLGFDSVWTTEHVVVGADAPPFYAQVIEPLTVLAFLAASLRRVKLGTSVLILPLHSPFVVAKQATTLQALSGGRFRLGVGAGWHETEYRITGIPFAERAARTAEAMRVIRALWSGQSSFEGRFWSFRDAVFGPLPEPAPELWVGTESMALLRQARKLGAIWHPFAPPVQRLAAQSQACPQKRIVPRFRVRLHGRPASPSTLGGTTEDVAQRLHEMRRAGTAGAILSFAGAEERAVTDMEQIARDILPQFESA
jgi:probable F420-dependent oxidoreductase